MHIKIKQNILLKAVDIHRHLVKEIKIEFSENGIRIFSVDPAHYEMVITNIPKTVCEEYNVENNLEIGIDMQKIKEYLRLFKKDDVLAFDYDADVNRLLGKEGNLTRGMGLLDLAGWPDPKIPKADLKNRVSVNTKIFYDSLKGIMSNKNYEQTYITTIRDSLILENQDDDEDHDKENRSVIMQDTGVLTVDYCNANDKNYTIFRSDFLIKQVNEYKKCFDKITIETSPNTPIRITADNDNLQVEYWLAPLIRDNDHERQVILEDQEEEIKPEPEISEEVKTDIEEQIQYEVTGEDFDKFSEDRHLDPPEQKDNWDDVKTDLENEQTVKDIGKKETSEEVEPVTDSYSDRLSICKPKHRPYKKQQWSQDMQYIKNTIEKHRLNRDTKQDRIKQVAEYKGFVFFINRPQTETELSYVKIKTKGGDQIIQQVLPDGYVLIAWFKWHENGWIAQTVKKAE